MTSIHRALLAIVLLPALSEPVFAHAGEHGVGGLLSGVIHPLLGWDHLLAIVAVGLWAARQPVGWGTRIVFSSIVLVWLTGMAAGSLLAFAFAVPSELAGAPAVSVLLAGLLLVSAVRLPLCFLLPTVTLFAFIHGIVHAGAIPATVSSPLYFAGMFGVTMGLQCLALAAGVRATGCHVCAGGGGAAAGSWLRLAA